MNIEFEILAKFHLSNETIVSDRYIRDNPDLMWVKQDIEPMIYVPSYMFWCVKNVDCGGNLVCDNTINALAEYGRLNQQDKSRLNFKNQCNQEQKNVVLLFLKWCLFNLDFCDEEQIKRTIKRWNSTDNDLMHWMKIQGHRGDY